MISSEISKAGPLGMFTPLSSASEIIPSTMASELSAGRRSSLASAMRSGKSGSISLTGRSYHATSRTHSSFE